VIQKQLDTFINSLLRYLVSFGHLVGKVKDLMFLPPLPPTVEEKKEGLMVVASTIDGGMLGRVWDELDYRIDVCRVTVGARIERL
jgi:hypothetical protein